MYNDKLTITCVSLPVGDNAIAPYWTRVKTMKIELLHWMLHADLYYNAAQSILKWASICYTGHNDTLTIDM